MVIVFTDPLYVAILYSVEEVRFLCVTPLYIHLMRMKPTHK